MTNTANGNDEAAQGLPADYAKNDALQKETGDEHKQLASRVGNWKVTTKYAAAFGGMEEIGTCTMKLIMNGKFLMSEGQTPMMGTPITTLGIFGFDTLSKEYSVTNFNSMYTGTYPMTGKLRKDGIIEYHGIMKDAMSPAGRTYRAEEKYINENKFEVVVFDGTDDKEFHVMTMTYDRAKSK